MTKQEKEKELDFLYKISKQLCNVQALIDARKTKLWRELTGGKNNL